MLKPVPEQTLDIQHDTDPADDHGPARRIPHLGHAILFFSMAFSILLMCGAAIIPIAHLHTDQQIQQHPGLLLAIQVLAYIVTLLAAAFIFSHIWQKPFLRGIEWNALAMRRHWILIAALSAAISVTVQLIDVHLPQPDKTPFDAFFHKALAAWALTVCGAILFPLAEEIAFRGFLLPALATAYDWLALDRTPAGLRRWESSTAHTTSAFIFATVFSSVAFVLLHAPEYSYHWALLSVLFAVSLFFSWVRVRYHSLAASFLAHATYNSVIFLMGIIASGGYRHLDKIS
jgi:membrane protease YdiL (CAAX protease family)